MPKSIRMIRKPGGLPGMHGKSLCDRRHEPFAALYRNTAQGALGNSDMACGIPRKQFPYVVDGLLQTMNAMEGDRERRRIEENSGRKEYSRISDTVIITIWIVKDCGENFNHCVSFSRMFKRDQPTKLSIFKNAEFTGWSFRFTRGQCGRLFFPKNFKSI